MKSEDAGWKRRDEGSVAPLATTRLKRDQGQEGLGSRYGAMGLNGEVRTILISGMIYAYAVRCFFDISSSKVTSSVSYSPDVCIIKASIPRTLF